MLETPYTRAYSSCTTFGINTYHGRKPGEEEKVGEDLPPGLTRNAFKIVTCDSRLFMMEESGLFDLQFVAVRVKGSAIYT